jgi:two-component system sensor histidine kinase KdpD
MADAPETKPGKLRVYIGAAPGVGKTFQMLEEAQVMRSQGVDVVGGLVEPHNRAETQKQIGDLEIIPLRAIEYHGVTLREMDLNAILARRPHTVIVDELAHSNLPGSRNRKRYQDVLELLDHGINVMTAVNVQHFETLNDAVSRSANTKIRETVPDAFLKRADEVVNVDVTVDELQARLRQGKVYPPEKIEQALANFFRKGNLDVLRELALRTVAGEVGAQAAQYRRTQGMEQAPLPEKVMVCLSSRPGSERLLRSGSRVASRLGTDWYAVYVEGPSESAGRIAGDAAQRLQGYLQMADELGAHIIKLKSSKIADALIEFAQREGISHVIFGQSVRSRWDVLLRGSVINRFLSEVRDATVQVVPMGKKSPRERKQVS